MSGWINDHMCGGIKTKMKQGVVLLFVFGDMSEGPHGSFYFGKTCFYQQTATHISPKMMLVRSTTGVAWVFRCVFGLYLFAF